MNGNFKQAWPHLGTEIWTPLEDFYHKGVSAPPELFSDLLETADDFLSPRLTNRDLEEAKGDPQNARRRFLGLVGTDFTSEAALADFIEEVGKVIADYEIEGYEAFYTKKIEEVLEKLNLRYRVDEPFALRILLPGSFSNLYSELSRANSGNSHLAGLWEDFERAFDRYARTQNEDDLRSSIAKTSNYLEGLAAGTRGKGGTLGRLCDSLSDWPHSKIKDALKDLYGFCSDYPGIRHAGSMASKLRGLDARDSVAINVSLMALAAYLGSGLDNGAVLGMGPSAGLNRKVVVSAPKRVTAPGILKRILAKIGMG